MVQEGTAVPPGRPKTAWSASRVASVRCSSLDVGASTVWTIFSAASRTAWRRRSVFHYRYRLGGAHDLLDGLGGRLGPARA